MNTDTMSFPKDFVITQPTKDYTPADHETWRTLYRRQADILPGRACNQFLQGLEKLGIGAEGIPDFDRASEVLNRATGWRLVAVPGLIPEDAFFTHLSNRRFPVTWWIRKPEQMDYLQEPDVFHDFFGHVPLLVNPIFADYMQAYGHGGMRALEFGTLANLARLYWYTVEFGLIKSDQGLRIYGSGILSSKGETLFSLESAAPNRIAFDLKRILRTRYRIDTYQKSYFVIESFDQLFEETIVDFASYYRDPELKTEIDAGAVLLEDGVITLGTGEGWANTPDI